MCWFHDTQDVLERPRHPPQVILLPLGSPKCTSIYEPVRCAQNTLIPEMISCLPTAGEACIILCSSLLALKLYGAEMCVSLISASWAEATYWKKKWMGIGRDSILSSLAPSIPMLDTISTEECKWSGQSLIPLNQKEPQPLFSKFLFCAPRFFGTCGVHTNRFPTVVWMKPSHL